jgi:outer membrane protein assembly factor BamB
MTVLRFPIAFICIFGLALSLPAADWPQWLGPKRDGGTPETIEPWKESPKVLWQAKVGVGFSTPVVAGGRVYVHARVNGKEREELIAFEAKTGKLLWREAYERTKYSSVLNTGPQATPTVAGNRVYTFGITGVLTCFDAEKGKQLWQVDTFKKLNAELPRFGVCCSPLVIGNRVLVAVNGKGSSVAAFDTDTGELQWQGLDEPASTSSPVLFATKGKAGALPDAVFMTTLRVIGLNPLDGSVNWEYALPFQPSGTTPTPVVSGDTIVTSTMTNGSTAILIRHRGRQGSALPGYQSVPAGASRGLGLSRSRHRKTSLAQGWCGILSLWRHSNGERQSADPGRCRQSETSGCGCQGISRTLFRQDLRWHSRDSRHR